MQVLSNAIQAYYFEHFNELPVDKQFHFASRLHLWDRDAAATAKLGELRPYFTAGNQPRQALTEVIQYAQASPIHGSKNAAALRQPYFEQYPQLKTYVTALFRLIFLKHIYGIDIRQAFFEHFPRPEVEAFAESLLGDQAALAILSTHAVNFLYLYSRVITKDESLFDPTQFLEIGARNYDKTDPTQLQLLIYLYTHCIIGESKFYYRGLPESATYQQMFAELEILIDKHFDTINLDNKFEFLVCARLVGMASVLNDRIMDEAARSVSDYGSFLIDRHNANPQTGNVSLAGSEHRNVLFILANRPYRPTGS